MVLQPSAGSPDNSHLARPIDDAWHVVYVGSSPGVKAHIWEAEDSVRGVKDGFYESYRSRTDAEENFRAAVQQKRVLQVKVVPSSTESTLHAPIGGIVRAYPGRPLSLRHTLIEDKVNHPIYPPSNGPSPIISTTSNVPSPAFSPADNGAPAAASQPGLAHIPRKEDHKDDPILAPFLRPRPSLPKESSTPWVSSINRVHRPIPPLRRPEGPGYAPQAHHSNDGAYLSAQTPTVAAGYIPGTTAAAATAAAALPVWSESEGVPRTHRRPRLEECQGFGPTAADLASHIGRVYVVVSGGTPGIYRAWAGSDNAARSQAHGAPRMFERKEDGVAWFMDQWNRGVVHPGATDSK